MKCSEYLWKKVQLDTVTGDGWSAERVQGEMRQILQDELIVSDTTGKVMSEHVAGRVYTRNVKELNKAYKENNRALFDLICTKQLAADDEYDAKNAQNR